MAAYRAIRIAEKVSLVGTIMGISTGRSSAGRAGRGIWKAAPHQKGIELAVIQVFDFMKGFAKV